MRVLATIRRVEYIELVALFFIHAMAMGVWFVPLSAVLDANGYHAIKPYAFAASGVAAFISPLVFGAMADRHVSPVIVLRGLALATAVSMGLATTAIKIHTSPWLVLALIQLHALCSAPTWSITNTIVLARLRNTQQEFGRLRAMATFGWMTGCWIISGIGADSSSMAGYTGVIIWLIVASFTFALPSVSPPKSAANLTLSQRMGWDALSLLKNRDHRVVFITAALFNATVASLFPFTPPHLAELGFNHITAWMSLAQVTEILAMFALAGMLSNWRLKWIIGTGLILGALRYALCAMNGKYWLLAGLTLHGCTFTLVLITAQIYVDQRVDPTWRARAQALMSLMTSGFGNLLGYLGTGWWFNATTTSAGDARWPIFWSGIGIAASLVLVYFFVAYHGRGTSPKHVETAGCATDEKGL